MSAPRIITQLVWVGLTIVGKAFAEAGKQAVRNASAGGASTSSTSFSSASPLTRHHLMTLDEACQILNVRSQIISRGLDKQFRSTAPANAIEEWNVELERMAKNYEMYFATNAPPLEKAAAAVAGKGAKGAKGGQGSFYLQSKVWRARERIEAEVD
ncbi:hypothetical protein BT69DRAFT_1348178, partial [Atractiella rhizophila]